MAFSLQRFSVGKRQKENIMAQPNASQPQREELKPGVRPNENVSKFAPKGKAPKEKEPSTNLQDDDSETEDDGEDKPSQAI